MLTDSDIDILWGPRKERRTQNTSPAREFAELQNNVILGDGRSPQPSEAAQNERESIDGNRQEAPTAVQNTPLESPANFAQDDVSDSWLAPPQNAEKDIQEHSED